MTALSTINSLFESAQIALSNELLNAGIHRVIGAQEFFLNSSWGDQWYCSTLVPSTAQRITREPLIRFRRSLTGFLSLLMDYKSI